MYQPPIQPDWRRPIDRDLAVQRHIEKALASGAESIEESSATDQQIRRFQRIELLKTLAFVLVLAVILAAVLFIVDALAR